MDGKSNKGKQRRPLLEAHPEVDRIKQQGAQDMKKHARERNRVDRAGGWKLTPTQRSALVEAVALYEDADTKTIREVFAELCHGDVPEIADSTIRNYRAKVRKELAVEAVKLREYALQTGVANKSQRVAALRRAYIRLGRLEESEASTQGRVMLARERRETLRQIALELGQLSGSSHINIANAAVAKAESGQPDDVDPHELLRVINELVEERIAMRDALAGAQRPPAEDLSDEHEAMLDFASPGAHFSAHHKE